MADTPPAPSAPVTPAAPATPPAPAAPPASSAPNDEVPKTWEDIFKHPRFKELNDQAQAAKTQLEEAERVKLKEEEDRKIKAGEYQTVIDQLRPEAERAKVLDKALLAVIDAEIKAMPESKRSLVPDLPSDKKLEWIVTNRAHLSETKPGDVNAPANPASTAPDGKDKTIFTLAQIKDPKFYETNKAAILQAQREGRIRD